VVTPSSPIQSQKWEGALKLVAGDESGFVELRGDEAGREGVVPAVGGFVPLHKTPGAAGSSRSDADGDAVEGDADASS
jgi:hypothetical protein